MNSPQLEINSIDQGLLEQFDEKYAFCFSDDSETEFSDSEISRSQRITWTRRWEIDLISYNSDEDPDYKVPPK